MKHLRKEKSPLAAALRCVLSPLRGAPRNAPQLLIGLSLLFIVVLITIPTGFEGAYQFKDAVKCKVLVEEVDNSIILMSC